MDEQMWALGYDRTVDVWEQSRGLRKVRVDRPTLDEACNPLDAEAAIIRVIYSGFCGSDRGIWFREAFRDMIHHSLDAESKSTRILGHEMLGEIVEVGGITASRYGFRPGDTVTTESHITCGKCYQCQIGDSHVCSDEKIIGFSLDGCFAEYVKLPARVLWRTDTERILPHVASVQEPFGNAVHVCSTVDLRGRSLAIFGCGTIGMFVILAARALGAAHIIGIEPNPINAEKARHLGADEVVSLPPREHPWHSDPEVVQTVRRFGGDGVDVAMEMSGYNSSLNNAIQSTRRGGSVVLFGLKTGDFTIQDYTDLIHNGITLRGVFGRRVFHTWQLATSLLVSRQNRIQDSIEEVILNNGEGSIVSIDDYEIDDFEKRILSHPKVIIRW